MAGFNQESSYQETMEALSYGQAVIEVPSLGSGTSTLKATDKYNEFSVRGGFFRVNYNYQDKYLLEVNGRYDGSSKFPKESRYGFFPSVSAGWNIAQEKFMESTQNWLGSLKLRASYGMIGIMLMLQTVQHRVQTMVCRLTDILRMKAAQFLTSDVLDGTGKKHI